MWIDSRELVSAALVNPNTGYRFAAAYCPDHKTLKLGDVVVVMETPRMENVFVRVRDNTIHALQDDEGQYVLLAPEPPTVTKKLSG